jgi:TonB family protein
MKTSILILLFSCLFSYGFSQTFYFEHPGSRCAVIKKEKLNQANLVSDLIPGFPDSRKDVEFISVEIISTGDQRTAIGKGTGDELTPEQKDILNAAETGTELSIKVSYRLKPGARGYNSGDGKIFEAEYGITPGPYTEAQFPGGEQEMTAYLDKSIIKKIVESSTPPQSAPPLSVAFTINEEGQVTDARISRTSASPETDKLVLDALANMPRWEPAKNSKGLNIKQKFILGLGYGSNKIITNGKGC